MSEEERRAEQRMAAINSITGETNAQVLDGKRLNSAPITCRQVTAKLRELRLLDTHQQLKPIREWNAQQKSDIVKFYRGSGAEVHSVTDYTADEAGQFAFDSNLASQLLYRLLDEAAVNPDMQMQLDPWLIVVMNWGRFGGRVTHAANGDTNEPGGPLNSSLLAGDDPALGFTDSWIDRLHVLEAELGGPAVAVPALPGQPPAPPRPQAGRATSKLSYWLGDVTRLVVQTQLEMERVLGFLRQLLGGTARVVSQRVDARPREHQW